MTLSEIYGSLGLALGVGLLIGLQREQSGAGDPEEQDEPSKLGGIRTFPLYSLGGAMAGLLGGVLGPWVVLAGMAGFFVPILLAYADDLRAGRDRGLTTEAAFLVTYLIGALSATPGVLVDPEDRALVVASLGVAVTALLALKRPLHDLAERVSSDDLFATIKFAVVALILLPVLPNETFGPLAVLNPRKIGWMIVLIAGVSFTGYLAIRLLGPGKGLGITGLLGGLVSSTAVTLAFSGRSRAEPGLARACALGVILANTIMPIRVIVNVSIVNPKMVGSVAVAMGAVAVAGLASVLLLLL